MSRSCFVVSAIGEPGTDERRRADKLLHLIIRKALGRKPLSLKVDRGDEIPRPGSITRQIIDRVLKADLIVADLTGYNPNVMYELAIAHAFGRPTLHMLHAGHRLPFDIKDQRTIFYTLELGDDKPVIAQLRAQASAVIDNPELSDNPVSNTLDLDALRQRRVTDPKLMGRLMEVIERLESRTEVSASNVNLLSPASGTVSYQGILPYGSGTTLFGGDYRSGMIPLTGLLTTGPSQLFASSSYSSGLLPFGKLALTCDKCGQPIAGAIVATMSTDGKVTHTHPDGECPEEGSAPAAKKK